MDATDPIAQFQSWLAEAEKSEPNDPNAVCLATSTPDGRPSARMVLRNSSGVLVSASKPFCA